MRKHHRRRRQRQPEGFLVEAFIDVDGTIAGTHGECKTGMGLSYKGIWGYAPLVVSLANTREVLYLVNRPGNAPSHQNSVQWIDRAVALVRPVAGRVTLLGDTAFPHTGQLDRWDDEGLGFVLGMTMTEESAFEMSVRRPKKKVEKHFDARRLYNLNRPAP